jgi:hypothetical protein
VDDIMTEDKAYMFTDGCGEISPDLLALAAEKLGGPKNLTAIQVKPPLMLSVGGQG